MTCITCITCTTCERIQHIFQTKSGFGSCGFLSRFWGWIFQFGGVSQMEFLSIWTVVMTERDQSCDPNLIRTYPLVWMPMVFD